MFHESTRADRNRASQIRGWQSEEVSGSHLHQRWRMNPALAQSAKSSREPSPASMATRLIFRAPEGICTSKRQPGESSRMTGLAAASLPSMKTLNTTLGYRARFEPWFRLTMFSSAPASPTNPRYSGLSSYVNSQG